MLTSQLGFRVAAIKFVYPKAKRLAMTKNRTTRRSEKKNRVRRNLSPRLLRRGTGQSRKMLIGEKTIVRGPQSKMREAQLEGVSKTRRLYVNSFREIYI